MQDYAEDMFMTLADRKFVPGESQVLPNGTPSPLERKSPPLSAVLPTRDNYLLRAPNAYFANDQVDREWDKLWTRTWLCAGRVSDLPETGCWLRFDFGRESFIVSRRSETEIVAFYNVCQHRGNRLVDDDFGRSPTFMCPYHSWRYDRSGRCTHVTDRELFSDRALAGKLDIPSVRCETFGGFVFINMDNDAQPLLEHFGEVAELVSGYQIDRMEVRSEIALALECNWKITLDAFSESYHVHITHPAAGPVTEDKYAQMDFYPNGHSRRIVPLGSPGTRRGRADAVHPMQKYLMVDAGIDPDRFQGNARDVRRALQLAKRAMTGKRAVAYEKLSDNQLTDDWAMNFFPNMHWSMHAEGVLVMWYNPDRSDPNKSTLHVMVLAHPGIPFEFYLPAATELEAIGRPKRVRVRHDDPNVKEVIGQLLYEDIRNTRETQRGVQSRGFGMIRLSEQEQVIMYQNAELDKYLQT